MSTPKIQLTDGTQQILQTLSEETGMSIAAIVEKAVAEYRRKVFFEGVDKDYAALKSDPEAWADELQERKLFQNTSMDGLDVDESWGDDGQVKN